MHVPYANKTGVSSKFFLMVVAEWTTYHDMQPCAKLLALLGHHAVVEDSLKRSSAEPLAQNQRLACNSIFRTTLHSAEAAS